MKTNDLLVRESDHCPIFGIKETRMASAKSQRRLAYVNMLPVVQLNEKWDKRILLEQSAEGDIELIWVDHDGSFSGLQLEIPFFIFLCFRRLLKVNCKMPRL